MQGIASRHVNATPRTPLTIVVMNDFEEALRRIKGVEFEAERVLIKLVAGNPSVRFSILLMSMKVSGQKQTFPFVTLEPFDLTEEWLTKFVTFDREQNALIIPISGVKELTLSDANKRRIFRAK